MVTSDFLVTTKKKLGTTSCLPHFLCTSVLLADVLMVPTLSSFRRMFTGHSPNSFVVHIFICSSIPELVASSFCLWPQHKLCGCTGHTLMICSASVEIEPSASLWGLSWDFSLLGLPQEPHNSLLREGMWKHTLTWSSLILVTTGDTNKLCRKTCPFYFLHIISQNIVCQRWLSFSSREQSTISLDISQNNGLLCCLHYSSLSPMIQHTHMCPV